MKTGIREEIAREEAGKRIVKIFVTLRKPMDEYQKTRSRYNLEILRLKHENKEIPPPPPGPDFEKLAKQNGLSAARTGLVSQWEALDRSSGRGCRLRLSTIILAGCRARVLQSAYQSPATFRPAVAVDADACYLYWKTKTTNRNAFPS